MLPLISSLINIEENEKEEYIFSVLSCFSLHVPSITPLSADPFTSVKFKDIELILFHVRQFYENDLASCTRLFSVVTMTLLSNKFLSDNLTPMKFQLLNFHHKPSTKRNLDHLTIVKDTFSPASKSNIV